MIAYWPERDDAPQAKAYREIRNATRLLSMQYDQKQKLADSRLSNAIDGIKARRAMAGETFTEADKIDAIKQVLSEKFQEYIEQDPSYHITPLVVSVLLAGTQEAMGNLLHEVFLIFGNDERDSCRHWLEQRKAVSRLSEMGGHNEWALNFISEVLLDAAKTSWMVRLQALEEVARVIGKLPPHHHRLKMFIERLMYACFIHPNSDARGGKRLTQQEQQEIEDGQDAARKAVVRELPSYDLVTQDAVMTSCEQHVKADPMNKIYFDQMVADVRSMNPDALDFLNKRNLRESIRAKSGMANDGKTSQRINKMLRHRREKVGELEYTLKFERAKNILGYYFVNDIARYREMAEEMPTFTEQMVEAIAKYPLLEERPEPLEESAYDASITPSWRFKLKHKDHLHDLLNLFTDVAKKRPQRIEGLHRVVAAREAV
jgi:hypothetical protein